MLEAWSEAYTELATALIDAEKVMYANADIAPGQLRAMRVVDVRNESEDIKSFVLEPVDGQSAPAFKPGQYLSISVTFDRRRGAAAKGVVQSLQTMVHGLSGHRYAAVQLLRANGYSYAE